MPGTQGEAHSPRQVQPNKIEVPGGRESQSERAKEKETVQYRSLARWSRLPRSTRRSLLLHTVLLLLCLLPTTTLLSFDRGSD